MSGTAVGPCATSAHTPESLLLRVSRILVDATNHVLGGFLKDLEALPLFQSLITAHQQRVNPQIYQCVSVLEPKLVAPPFHVYRGSWFKLEPRVDHGEDSEDRGGQATGPDKGRPCRVNPKPVQWDEDVAAVLQQV